MLVLVITAVVLGATHADLTIYEHIGKKGRSTTMKNSGDVPSGWNDIVSSVCASASGSPWKIFDHSGYKGAQAYVAPGACMDVPSWFNDKMSSAQIQH